MRVVALPLIVAILVIGMTELSEAGTYNRTPGNLPFGCEKAICFSPMHGAWPASDSLVKAHLNMDGPLQTGEHYDWEAYLEPTPTPSQTAPTMCTLDAFRACIDGPSARSHLSVLYINTHGDGPGPSSVPGILIERYDSINGEAPATFRWNQFLQQGYSTSEIYVGYESSVSGPCWGIYVTSSFIQHYYNAGKTMVIVDACNSAFDDTMISIAKAFVTLPTPTNAARMSVGHPNTVTPGEALSRLTHLLNGLQGRRGFKNRPAEEAIVGSSMVGFGSLNTTLSPAVSRIDMPCPIRSDMVVTFHFDTACRTTKKPVVVSNQLVWKPSSPNWRDEYTLDCVVEAPEDWVYKYGVILEWENCESADNVAKLDGNTEPAAGAGRNKSGFGHNQDDYRRGVDCDDLLKEQYTWTWTPGVPKDDGDVTVIIKYDAPDNVPIGEVGVSVWADDQDPAGEQVTAVGEAVNGSAENFDDDSNQFVLAEISASGEAVNVSGVSGNSVSRVSIEDRSHQPSVSINRSDGGPCPHEIDPSAQSVIIIGSSTTAYVRFFGASGGIDPDGEPAVARVGTGAYTASVSTDGMTIEELVGELVTELQLHGIDASMHAPDTVKIVLQCLDRKKVLFASTDRSIFVEGSLGEEPGLLEE